MSEAPSPRFFPWADVEAAQRDVDLDREHPPGEGLAHYLEHASGCPSCGKDAGGLEWIYFVSPAWTWQQLVGREGWLTVCRACELQVVFFVEILS